MEICKYYLLPLLFSLFYLPIANPVQTPAPASSSTSRSSARDAAIWREPTDIETRNLFYGSGGKDRQPMGMLTFLEEDMDGNNPKFQVEDERGIRWKIKLGSEAQPETAATRLLWAAGYFVDEVYYFPEVRVKKMQRLQRGQKFVGSCGIVRGARIERDERGDKKLGDWSWFENPFRGTRELNGLRVMMALINNWDPKRDNNAIRERQGIPRVYYVSDLGSSFGRTGSTLSRSRNDVKGYTRSKFIRRVDQYHVDFVFRTRPSFFLILYPPYYCGRTKLEKIAQDIPLADARWLGELLSKLSSEQIADAFRAAGYNPEQTAQFTKEVIERISDLKNL